MAVAAMAPTTIVATLSPGVSVELGPNVCVANQRYYYINYNPQRHLVWSEKLFGSTLFREAPFI